MKLFRLHFEAAHALIVSDAQRFKLLHLSVKTAALMSCFINTFYAALDGLLRNGLLQNVCDPCVSKTTYPSNNLETATAAVFDATRLPTRPHPDICHRRSCVIVNKGR